MNDYELYVLAKESIAKNNTIEAISLLEHSASICNHFKTQLLLADCYEKLNMADKYIKCIEYAYRLHPESNEASVKYGICLLQTGKISEAKEIVTQVLTRSPNYGPAKKIFSIIENSK